MYFTENAQMYTYNVGWFFSVAFVFVVNIWEERNFGFLEEVSAISNENCQIQPIFDFQ